MLRHQLGHQLGGITTSLLGIEVANLFWLLHHGYNCLVVALFWTLFKGAAGATKLRWQLFTFCVTHKLARSLLHVLCRARRLVHGGALFVTLAVTNLLNWGVTLANCLIESLLVESDGAGFLKVLLANLLLARGEGGDIGVMALLNIFVGAFQYWILLHTRHALSLLHAAEAGLRIFLAA